MRGEAGPGPYSANPKEPTMLEKPTDRHKLSNVASLALVPLFVKEESNNSRDTPSGAKKTRSREDIARL